MIHNSSVSSSYRNNPYHFDGKPTIIIVLLEGIHIAFYEASVDNSYAINYAKNVVIIVVSIVLIIVEKSSVLVAIVAVVSIAVRKVEKHYVDGKRQKQVPIVQAFIVRVLVKKVSGEVNEISIVIGIVEETLVERIAVVCADILIEVTNKSEVVEH